MTLFKLRFDRDTFYYVAAENLRAALQVIEVKHPSLGDPFKVTEIAEVIVDDRED